MARIIVGLSGGVDSSVTAALLQQQGHEVIGLFMKNWDETTGSLSGKCPWKQDRIDALRVASQLNIPCQTVDFRKEYREQVVEYMFDEYKRGRTPNPDVLCNREVKFKHFFDHAITLGADFVATGHYARTATLKYKGKERAALLAGVDSNKDQSYFLCQLDEDRIAKTLFPLGGMEKPMVRQIAEELDLATAHKRDSQGICFVGKVNIPTFLKQKLASKLGDIIEVDAQTGKEKKVGSHDGAHFFTRGQRKGLDVGGTELPLFVIDTDVEKNIVYVGQGTNHPRLFQSSCTIQNNETHWIWHEEALPVGESKTYLVRIRHRQPLQSATLSQKEYELTLSFDQPQRAIMPGQFAAWYDQDRLVGSGPITSSQ